MHIGTTAKSLPGDGLTCSPRPVHLPRARSDPVVPSSKEPTASCGFQDSPSLDLWYSHRFPVLLSIFLPWALCYSRTQWFVFGRACIIPYLYVYTHNVPHQLGSTPFHPMWEVFPHLLSQAGSKFYFFSSLVLHLFRYAILIWNYLRNHIVVVCLSVGRQRHAIVINISVPKAKHHFPLNQGDSKEFF